MPSLSLRERGGGRPSYPHNFSDSSSSFPPLLHSSRIPIALLRLQRTTRNRSLSGCNSSHSKDLAVTAANPRRKSDRFCDSGKIYPYQHLVRHKYYQRNRTRKKTYAPYLDFSDPDLLDIAKVTTICICRRSISGSLAKKPLGI